VGKPDGSARGMRRDDSGDTGQERHVQDAEILPVCLALLKSHSSLIPIDTNQFRVGYI
jgi:hypothetical protein